MVSQINSLPWRRFGRTEIKMPVLSLGGMRFQQSWKALDFSEINQDNQQKLDAILRKAFLNGFNHLETAHHYGSSELQIGLAMESNPNPKRILQTKIPPNDDPNEFESELKLSFKRLKCTKLDLIAIHGINLPEHLEKTIRPGGCLDVVRRWQSKGLIGHVGFSTHAHVDLIIKTINTNLFDYVNLHWYFIRQDNLEAIRIANKLDLGVFIISPTDKGGHLHTPSNRLLELCDPLHPIIFNDLFCLRDPRIHTLSVGASRAEDLDLHLQAISLLNRDSNLISQIEKRFIDSANSSLGELWMATWSEGLPSWEDTPGNMNIPILLWLYNLITAWGMDSFVKERYSLLGRGGHWFPGTNADYLDREVGEDALLKVLEHSPWQKEIPDALRKLRSMMGEERKDRLWGI